MIFPKKLRALSETSGPLFSNSVFFMKTLGLEKIRELFSSFQFSYAFRCVKQ